MIRPQHIKSRPDDISERVVVVGDPARAEFLAENMLERTRLVNRNRGFLVYTGEYKGVPVTVAVHGVGAASSAIVFEELKAYGAKAMVRLGTAGGLIEDLDIGDFVVAAGAYYNPGGTIGQYFGSVCPAASPDPLLTTELLRRASERGRARLGFVFSSDAFYAEDPSFARRISALGPIAVEMEAATLFSLAALRGFKAAALLVISNNLVVPGKEALVGYEELVGFMYRASEAVLEALTSAKL